MLAHMQGSKQERGVCVCVQNALMEGKKGHFLQYLYKLTE